jgi:methionine synthase I (cobalamin-dependent)
VEAGVSSFLQRVESGKMLVADGATGTNLQASGVLTSGHTEDLIIDHPEIILALERNLWRQAQTSSDMYVWCNIHSHSGIRY